MAHLRYPNHSILQSDPKGLRGQIWEHVHHVSLENGKSILIVDIAQSKKQDYLAVRFFIFLKFVWDLKSRSKQLII